MTAVTEKNLIVVEENARRPLAVVPEESGTLMKIIAQAARDPEVDINKMERLMQMHERLSAREAENVFNAAMTECQIEMKPISADATNPQTRSKYASYAKLDSVLRPIYTGHGFALSFDEGDSPKPDYVRVLCYVSHIGGHSRTYRRDMPADGKGAKGGDVMTKTHAAGAAGSYGSRYLLKGIFNVAVGESDNDGNGDDGLAESVIDGHLTKIDEAKDEASLKRAFAAGWTEAQAADDKQAMRRLTEAKDAQKKKLGVKK